LSLITKKEKREKKEEEEEENKTVVWSWKKNKNINLSRHPGCVVEYERQGALGAYFC